MYSNYEVMPSPVASTNALFRNIASFLDRVEYRLCRDAHDMTEIAKLRYRAYSGGSLYAQNELDQLIDDLDYSPNCFVFGIFLDGILVSTIRIHYVSNECTDSLSAKIFPDIVLPRVAQGEAFIDPTKFAVDPEFAGKIRALPFLTIRMASMACEYFPVNGVLTLIAGHHSGFYEKIFKAKTVGEPRAVEGVLVQPKLMICSKYDFRDHVLTNYPFLLPRPGEPEALFPQSMRTLN